MIPIPTQDLVFFSDLYTEGDRIRFEKEFIDYFDERAPQVKRAEFNKLRHKLYEELGESYGYSCMLNLLEACLDTENLAIDHLIPLSSNELNKKLRNVQSLPSKKVVTQSYGSNNIKNLAIACSKCNDFKKHRFLNSKQWLHVMTRKQGL